MDITFLAEYAVPLIIGICLCIGYILKNLIPTDKVDRFIPLIMGILGIVINIWLNMAFTPTILLGGVLSGLASTGLHQVFKQFINKDDV
ncbi:phage holin family protein [Congzhengia minquanensis]|uniref:Phage holin family protein n=1 Tax=Congzhengia minquanensis TaxID=2763657 RepID=A0A926DKY5_9FIRM|nr:phage holin family protein [Congzhengia minquanensis]MBC8540848.1 phage holin family protein [Congzhengia minquanensis]